MLSKARQRRAITEAKKTASEDFHGAQDWSEICFFHRNLVGAGMVLVERTSLKMPDCSAFGELFARTYEEEIARLVQEAAAALKVNDRGIFRWDNSYCPHFSVKRGFHGQVLFIEDHEITLKVIEPLEDPETWNNEVIIVPEEVEGFQQGLEYRLWAGEQMSLREFAALWFRVTPPTEEKSAF